MAEVRRIIRATLGTGVTFAAGVGVVASIVAGLAVLAGQGSAHALFGMAGRFTVVAFLLGVAFSALLALAARRRWLAELSVGRGAALGGGAGLLYFALLALNAAARWSTADAVVNLVVLTVLGAGAAAGTLALARRGRPALAPGDAVAALGAGDAGQTAGRGTRGETRSRAARE